MLHARVTGWAASAAIIAGLLISRWLLLGGCSHGVVDEVARWSTFCIAFAILCGVVFGVVAGLELAGAAPRRVRGREDWRWTPCCGL